MLTCSARPRLAVTAIDHQPARGNTIELDGAEEQEMEGLRVS